MLSCFLAFDGNIFRRAEQLLEQLDQVDQVDMIQPEPYENGKKGRFCPWLKCYLSISDPPCKKSCADCMAPKEKR